jgi:hypothetical protein
VGDGEDRLEALVRSLVELPERFFRHHHPANVRLTEKLRLVNRIVGQPPSGHRVVEYALRSLHLAVQRGWAWWLLLARLLRQAPRPEFVDVTLGELDGLDGTEVADGSSSFPLVRDDTP